MELTLNHVVLLLSPSANDQVQLVCFYVARIPESNGIRREDRRKWNTCRL